MTKGRLVFPALPSLVEQAARFFPYAVLCAASGSGCGLLGVAHNGAHLEFLGKVKAAHRAYCSG